MSVDRRAYPRYPVDFRVRVRPLDIGDDFAADATMLSRSSVQVKCDANLVLTLVKRTQPPYVCDMAFNVPDQEQPLVLRGQVLTHRRVSQQQYVLVFLFKEIDEQQERGLVPLLKDKIPQHPA
jgi:hypothetical protein